ncbi:MAG: isocitrate/isopropylmalate dehydrogenase family protein [Firmicutes bacterium]|nr:isocitrate/isopropylmalate dehydrogenase family protein [Bacillota bacterium]
MTVKVTLIPGDGIGEEVSAAMRLCVEAALNATSGNTIEWDVQPAGAEVIEKEGTPIPERVLDSIKKNRVAIKGPLTTPIGTGFRSVNVAIRQALDLYANLRPAKYYEGVRTPVKDVDIVVVRENTEDLYAGIEFEEGKPETVDLIKELSVKSGKSIRTDSGISIKPISVTGTERIIRFAFEYAGKNGRKKVTAVHKANIMKFTDGLFLETARKIAESYRDIKFEDVIVDNMCMQLVQKPELYEILVCPNLYGDIISDLCSGLVGGLGMTPSGNFGAYSAVFEAVHGSAPKYKGLNKVNPTAMILSGVMMLKHLGEEEASKKLESAVAKVIREGKSITYDLKEDRNAPTAVGTREMAEAIAKEVLSD